MRLHKINLLEDNRREMMLEMNTPRRFSRLMALAIFGLIFGAAFGVGRLSLTESASAAIAKMENLPVIKQMHLIGSQDRRLIGEEEGRINILLLGMGGEGHDGAYLTDTVILMSIRPQDNRVAMLSVPRDLLVPIGNAGWRKVNSANAFGELQTPGRGGDYSRTVLEQTFGLEIPYYVRIDFNGFRDVIDSIGGIDLTVERDFVDNSYPTENYGYQQVSFTAGPQHMDGETALRYARSRHGNNGEGSDFARGRRQQKMLTALKDKLFSFNVLRSPSTISNLMADFKANVTTNLQVGEILRLAKMGRGVTGADISHLVLDDGPGSPLVAGYYGGAYVLMPREDDWSSLHQAAITVFDQPTETPAAAIATETNVNAAPTEPPPIADAKIRLEVQNGSGRAGLAKTVAATLAERGFQVTKYGNAASFDHAKTIVFDYTSNRNPAALADLLKSLKIDAEVVADTSRAATLDYLVLIGQDLP